MLSKMDNAALEKKKLQGVIKLASMTIGNLFGEDDLVLERPHLGTVTCKSNTGSLYCMKISEFIRMFRKNDESWKIILDQIKMKHDM